LPLKCASGTPLIQRDGATAHPVRVRLGDCSEPFAGRRRGPIPIASRLSLAISFVHPRNCTLSWSSWTRIVVAPDANASPARCPSLPAGHHLHRALPAARIGFHSSASAVSGEPINGKTGVVAFLARSGQGKSSLAAHLGQRGFRVGPMISASLTPRTRRRHGDPCGALAELWRNSLQNLGWKAEGLERVFSDDDKYRCACGCAGAGTHSQADLPRRQ